MNKEITMNLELLKDQYKELMATADAISQKEHISDEEYAEAFKKTAEAKAIAEKIKNIEAMNEDVKNFRTQSTTSSKPMSFNSAPTDDPEADEDLLESKHYQKAFINWMRNRGHVDKLNTEEKANLYLGDDGSGGYLAPTLIQAGVLKKQAQIGSVVNAVTVRTLTGPVPKSLTVPYMVYTTDDIWSSGVRMNSNGETPTDAQTLTTNPVFGEKTINMTTHITQIPVTMDLIESSSQADVLSMLSDLIVDTVALDEEQWVLKGTGTNEPIGILASPGGGAAYPSTIAVGASNNFTNTLVEQALFNIPAQYARNSSWVFNFGPSGAGLLYGLKDSAGRAIYNAGLNEVAPGVFARTIMGQPVYFSAFMDDVSGTYPAIVGDLSGYTLIRGGAVSIRVLDQPLASTNRVSFLARVRIGGNVLEPWKIKVGTVA